MVKDEFNLTERRNRQSAQAWMVAVVVLALLLIVAGVVWFALSWLIQR